MIKNRLFTLVSGFICIILLQPTLAIAAISHNPDRSVSIAVAANFYGTLKKIAQSFHQETQIPVKLSTGSTGMLYAQILRGAPYDLFFAADAKRPILLEKTGNALKNSRFTYAMGQLVVWSLFPKSLPPALSKRPLMNPKLRFFAIANPKTAPYGAAALKVLEHYKQYQLLKKTGKLVFGENVGKTYQYIATGNAQMGMVAKSYMKNGSARGRYWEVPQALYPKIKQQAVVLRHHNTPEVQKFLAYFKTPKIQKFIQDSGYGLGQ